MDKELLIFIKAIGEPKRLLILNSLKQQCCVGELWKCLAMPQNLTSHHLQVLKKAKLIVAEKHGSKVVYQINQEEMDRCLKQLQDYLK
jgi:ArsR family transcriptional regulator